MLRQEDFSVVMSETVMLLFVSETDSSFASWEGF